MSYYIYHFYIMITMLSLRTRCNYILIKIILFFCPKIHPLYGIWLSFCVLLCNNNYKLMLDVRPFIWTLKVIIFFWEKIHKHTPMWIEPKIFHIGVRKTSTHGCQTRDISYWESLHHWDVPEEFLKVYLLREKLIVIPKNCHKS